MSRMEEKEEGEISLEDVSSSDDDQPNFGVHWMSSSARPPTGKIYADRDAGHGKENRHYSREIIESRYAFATLQEKNDDLLPVSSHDELEVIGMPGSSHQLHIRVGKKKRKKKKKKKNNTNGIMLIDDLVSTGDPDPIILNVPNSRFDETEILVHRRRRSPSPKSPPPRHSPCPRAKAVSKSPLRSPLSMYRSQFRGRSPLSRNRYSRSPSPKRRSPRKLRSPRKSPIPSSREKSPRRTCCYRSPHGSPDRYANHYASTLLKKVRKLDSVGTGATISRKHKEQGSSLKDKLSNILKGSSDVNKVVDPVKKEEVKSDEDFINDNQEEEDLELLRKKALETKQPKLHKVTEQSKNSSIQPSNLSDNENEDLELRMIALRSAVMKKHQKRVKKGTKKKTKDSTRDMSPFADSFLNELNETEEQNHSAESSSNMSPSNQQVEDMDLDTDVEREEENYSSPYSPTDEVMSNIPELDGAQNLLIGLENQLITNSSGVHGNEAVSQKNINFEVSYSPSDSTRIPWVEKLRQSDNTFPLKNSKTIIQANTNCDDDNGEAPYSPSDTPIYDPEFNYSLLEFSENQNDDNCAVLDLSLKETPKELLNGSEVISSSENMRKVEKDPVEPSSKEAPNDTMVTNDKIGETQENKKRKSDMQNSQDSSNTGNADTDQTAKRISDMPNCEPLYLQGIPNVTKDPNKVPTLINRALVPVSILKTNKKLQQPLPHKKLENHVEPAFKSAKMQPVDVVTQPVASNAGFKPIRLQPIAKKPSVVIPAAAFNNSLVEESNVEKSENASVLIESTYKEESKVMAEENTHCNGDAKNVSHEKVLQLKGKRCERKRAKNLKRSQKRSASTNILDNSKENLSINESLVERNHTVDESENQTKFLEVEKQHETADLTPNNDAKYENECSGEKIDDQSRQNELEPSTNDNTKRRNSIEEDEETLRAILLASLAKRPKTNESINKVQKASENVSNPSGFELNINQKKIVEDKNKMEQPNIGQLKTSTNTPSIATNPVPSIVSTGPAQATTVVSEAKKRPNPVAIKGPPKKIMKKISIPVSTKVVNNAKKFQNIMMQKKLIIQNQMKVVASTSRNLTVNNVKASEPPAPMSPKIAGSGKVQRLVINLGEDSGSDSEQENPTEGIRPPAPNEPRAELAIPTTDFEKSVDQFLKDQRKKQESMTASNPVSSTPTSAARGLPVALKKSADLSTTPLAVRHLPPLQQEEYKRLKQKILEKERQQAKRQKSSMTPSSLVSAASSIANATKLNVKKASSSLIKINNTDNSETKVTANVQTVAESVAKIMNNTTNMIPQEKNIFSSTSSQLITNLSIQIPNDESVSEVRIDFSKQHNSEQESVNSVPVLKVLSKEQLNSRFVHGEGKQSEASLIPSKGSPTNTETNFNLDDRNDYVNADNKQSEVTLNETQKSIAHNQTNEGYNVTSETVDSEASTVIFPPRIGENEAAERSGNESSNTTINLENTIEERIGMPIQKYPKKSRNSRSPVKEHSEKIKSDVRSEMETFILLSKKEQKTRLIQMEDNLVTKRYAVLKDLSEMSSSLQQWDMERELQNNLFAEVKKLKLQLAMAEERLREQRNKIHEIAPKVTIAHKTIVDGRTECLKLTKLCEGFGSKVIGPEYKVPVAGGQLMRVKLKEVAYHTRQLSKKGRKVPYVNTNGEAALVGGSNGVNTDSDCSTGDQSDGNTDIVNSDVEQHDNSSGVVISRSIEESHSSDLPNGSGIIPGSSSTSCIGVVNQRSLNVEETSSFGEFSERQQDKQAYRARPYESVLSHFGTPRHIDMHRELCPFELTGICKDDSCFYNHLDPMRKQ